MSVSVTATATEEAPFFLGGGGYILDKARPPEIRTMHRTFVLYVEWKPRHSAELGTPGEKLHTDIEI